MVVLGKRLLDDGSPTNILAARMAFACKVFREQCGPHDMMIVTGGRPAETQRSEAEVMCDMALGKELGQLVTVCFDNAQVSCQFGALHESQIILEDKARTTVENAFLIREKLEKFGVSEILLVIDDFHMRRARFIFQEVFAAKLGQDKLSGLHKVLNPVLDGRQLLLKPGLPCPCTISTHGSTAPLPAEVRQSEDDFEASLPNSRMLEIIRQVLTGVPERIGSNTTDTFLNLALESSMGNECHWERSAMLEK